MHLQKIATRLTYETILRSRYNAIIYAICGLRMIQAYERGLSDKIHGIRTLAEHW